MTDTDRSFTSMLEDAQGSSAGQTRILVIGVRCAMLEMVTMVDFASYAGEPWNQSYVDLDPLFFVISAENSLQWHPELDLVHAVCLELFICSGR